VNAPAGPAAPVVPAESSSQAPHTQFRDVYQSVPTGENSSGEPTAKQQDSDSKGGGPKRQSRADGNDKTAAVLAIVSGSSLVRSPLVLALSLGQESTGEQDGSSHESQTEAGSAGEPGTHSLLPHGITLTPSPTALVSLPSASSMAFSIRLKPEMPPATGQITTQAVQSRSQSSSALARELPHAASSATVSTVPEPEQVTPGKGINHFDATAVREFALTSSIAEARPISTVADAPETMHTSAVSGVHDVQAILPEAPKATPSAEILLHLPGKDQSVAAVRLVDRSGTVNVSVHASDPELRNTLRSSLGDLASQLNGQGFKTEVVKPTVVAAHADNAQDSRHDGQRSASHQQQSTPGDRQPQRDRRTNSGQWLEELEQETSGDAGTQGGTK